MNINFENIKDKFEEKANAIYNDNTRLKKLLISVKEMVNENKQLAEILDDIKSMMGLLVDWIKGDYHELQKSSAIMIIISFLYLLNPFDLIPDFLFAGFVDDIAVIGLVFKKLSEEIDRYKEWKSLNHSGTYKKNDFQDTNSDDYIEINLNDDEYDVHE